MGEVGGAGGARLFRKKPVVVEARQTGQDYDEDCAIVSWCGGRAVGPDDGYDTAIIAIDTLEGTMTVEPGDWVVKGVKGEFYPCKPDIFEATYSAVSWRMGQPVADCSRAGQPVCRPEEHDWRVDPHRLYMSAPPQQKLVCAKCGTTSARVAPGTKVYGRDPREWPKA